MKIVQNTINRLTGLREDEIGLTLTRRVGALIVETQVDLTKLYTEDLSEYTYHDELEAYLAELYSELWLNVISGGARSNLDYTSMVDVCIRKLKDFYSL